MRHLFLVLPLLCACGVMARSQSPADPEASVVISEVLASNVGGLRDEDGDSPDWIEIHHPGVGAVSLAGWSLTDSEGIPARWTFPDINLEADTRLVVFASGKNRTNATGPLHTQFKLSADGGYVALVRPDGHSVASEIRFGPQRRNVSVGPARVILPAWVTNGAAARMTVPTHDAEGRTWTGATEPYSDGDWSPVRMGVGFDSTTADSGLIAYWDFDDVANSQIADRSGGNHPGTLQGASLTEPGAGHSGSGTDRSVRFTGSGWMEVPAAAAGLFDSATAHDAITISLWVRGDDSQPSNDSIFWAGSDAGGGGIRSLNAHLPWSDQVIYWDTAGCCDPGAQRISVAEPDPTKWRGQWNHYAFVKRGDRKEIWQNGRLLYAADNLADLTSIRSFYLGTSAPGQSGYHGWVDDVALWDTALEPATIASLAAGVSPLGVRRLTTWIATDVEPAMSGRNASAYLRIPFELADPPIVDFLVLRVRYDDGFVAYLNGMEIARRNTPENPLFNSTAPASRSNLESSRLEELGIPASLAPLHSGHNLLAFQVLNHTAEDPDLLLQAELAGGQRLGLRQFPEPTPGAPNGEGVEGFVAEPHVEPGRGFFVEPVSVTLSTETPGASIAYTTDGALPSPTQGTVVAATTATIFISRTTVLRAVAFREGLETGSVVTHTYLFPGDVAGQRRPVGLPAKWPDGSPTDFTVDARVVNQAQPGHSFQEALLQIPSVSLVLPQQDLFGAASGIYAHSDGHGDTWEREASLEWVQPDGAREFQQNISLGIHGGISRDKGFTPKHGFRLSFSGKFGPGSLSEAVLPDTPVRGFQRLLLRAGSTDTWPCVEWGQIVDGVQRWYRKEASSLRDQVVRDMQIAMGQPSAHGTYVHLYLNGSYWGLYNLCERPDNDFLALHLGGRGEEYDSLADFAEVHAGNSDAWNRLMSLSAQNLAQNANYQRLLGNRADGTRDPQLEVLLDVDNLIDYMVLHIFIGADDWPNHNWWAGRRRGPDSTGFKFFAWDQEISISSLVRQHSSWGPIYAEADAANTPAYVYSRCRRNAEFRQRFADRVQQHLFGHGALSISNNVARWAARVAGVDQAIVAESARWGDYQRPAKPYLREVEWLANDRWMRETYFPSNHVVALKRFRTANLYPRLDAPEVSPSGGLVTPGTEVSLRNPGATGTLWFTTDGSDPRLPGGDVSPSATEGAGPLTINTRTVVRLRVRDGAVWSALVEATYFTPDAFAALQLTEIHYHPPDVGSVSGELFEFIELQNMGNQALDLEGLQLSTGITFTFSPGSVLAPGAYGVLVRDAASFARRFPGVTPMGVFTGGLDNGGETLTLGHPLGLTVFSFAYRDAPPWPPAADGVGLSLQRYDPLRPPGRGESWVAAPPTPGAALDLAQADSDGDGMADFWERLFGLDPLRPDGESDADSDGLSAREEFLSGTNPHDPLSVLRLLVKSVAAGNGELELHFTAVSGHSYQVERRDALDGGGWTAYARIDPPRATEEAQIPVLRPAADTYFRIVTPAP